MLLLLLLELCIAAILSPNKSTEHDEMIAALSAGIEHWQKQVEFRSTFRIRKGRAISIERALTEGIDPNLSVPPSEVFEATGVFHRKGELQRLSIDHGRGPIVVKEAGKDHDLQGKKNSLPADKRFVKNISFDEVTNGRLQVRYEPGESGDVAYVERRKPDLLGVGIHTAGILSPLNPFVNPNFQPFMLWDVGQKKKDVPDKRNVIPHGKEHLEVVLEQEDAGWRQERRILFWTSQSPPVVTAIDETIKNPRGQVIEHHVRLSNFKPAGGGVVARNVLNVSKSVDGVIRVTEWKSEDLGDSPPSESDFAVKIAPTTSLAGLKHPPTGDGAERIIDITKIPEAELGNEVYTPPRPKNRSSSKIYYIVGLVLSGTALAAIGIFRYRKRRIANRAR